MLRRVGDWLDERTGYRSLIAHALDEDIAGGARFIYVFGSALLVIFTCQVITGLLLMATYTPAVNGAWSSVFYVQHKVSGGWFVRGLHAYGAQAMIVVLGLHLLQVTIYGAYRKPREVTWWFGLALLAIVSGLALTGYLLPWDQKGYWATKVATNIMGTVPVVGASLQTLVVGGSDYGQSTLTRFYVLHVGVLPATLVLMVVGHVALFRKHGATPPHNADLKVVGKFYPTQLALDVLFSVVVLFTIAILTASTGGVHLDAPADPSVDYPPRPEWYFLSIFQLLKYLPGSMELLGTIILPGLVGVFLFALPFLDRSPTTNPRTRMQWLAPIFVGLLGAAFLTWQSLHDDANDENFQRATAAAHVRAQRAIELASQGIPPGGPVEMLRNDPETRGPDLYAAHCTKCHVLNQSGEYDAPVHTGFASRAWIAGMLHDPQDPRYFGRTEIDDMKSMDEKLDDAERKAVIEFVFAEGAEPDDRIAPDKALAEQGAAVFKDKCMDCHLYKGEGADTFDGPDMTGYGSREWIAKQIAKPESIYGDLNKMPDFAEDLGESDIQMLAIYLRGQRFQEPETGPLPELKPKDKNDE